MDILYSCLFMVGFFTMFASFFAKDRDQSSKLLKGSAFCLLLAFMVLWLHVKSKAPDLVVVEQLSPLQIGAKRSVEEARQRLAELDRETVYDRISRQNREFDQEMELRRIRQHTEAIEGSLRRQELQNQLDAIWSR